MISPENRFPLFAWFTLVLALALILVTPDRARAGAREHFLRGEAAYQQGNYELAIREWEKAYRLEKRPRIQYNLALAYERLGQLEKAVETLKRFIESCEPDDPALGDATTRLTAIKERLSRTGIKIIGGVEGARIMVDGREWGRTPRPDRIPVKPGSHNVVIRLKNYRDFVSNVVVPAGQEVEVTVRMKRGTGSEPGSVFFDESSSKPADPHAAVTSAGSSSGNGATGGEEPSFFEQERAAQEASSDADPTVWYIVSGGLAAGAIGAAIWTADRAGQLSDCDEPDIHCANQDTVRREQNLAALTTIVFGAGAIGALVYGLTLDAGNSAAEEDEKIEEAARAVPCLPGVLGAQCAIRF